MTKEEAVSVINGEKTIDSTLGAQTSQPEEQVETVTEENTTPSEETKTEVPEDNDGNNEAVEDVPEKDVEDKTSRKKKTYTPLQKQQYAFKMQKARWRKAEERNAQQAEEIEKLKAELEKYKGLTLEDFGNDQQKYLDYQVDQRMGRERVNSMTEQLDYQRRQMEMQEASEIANERLMNCYPDEAEREKYQKVFEFHLLYSFKPLINWPIKILHHQLRQKHSLSRQLWHNCSFLRLSDMQSFRQLFGKALSQHL